MADIVKAGEDTTEFAVTQSANLWGTIATILGGLITIGSAVLPQLGDNSKVGIIGGAVIAVAGIVLKALTSMGYIKARADVKSAASGATSETK